MPMRGHRAETSQSSLIASGDGLWSCGSCYSSGPCIRSKSPSYLSNRRQAAGSCRRWTEKAEWTWETDARGVVRWRLRGLRRVRFERYSTRLSCPRARCEVRGRRWRCAKRCAFQ